MTAPRFSGTTYATALVLLLSFGCRYEVNSGRIADAEERQADALERIAEALERAHPPPASQGFYLEGFDKPPRTVPLTLAPLLPPSACASACGGDDRVESARGYGASFDCICKEPTP